VTAELRLPLVDAPARGERRMVELGGHRIGLYRVGEELFALADRCPHRGAPLCSNGAVVDAVEGVGDAARVTRERALVRCPWHKWDFDIATGRCAVDARLRVRRYPVRVDGGELVVSLDAGPAAG
jgi:3-phenylpropionate/trans-cinnamate dioxygenase ferredoxin subunit